MRRWQEGWTAGEADELRVILGWKIEVFARRLKIHKRTALRWKDRENDPAPTLWDDLDDLLMEAARKLAPWLAPDQLVKMQRREVLKLLAASTVIPVGGVDLWNGVVSGVSNSCLSSLEEITTVLAGRYYRDSPHLLLGPVMGHLEKATSLLSGVMRPSQRTRLESIVADAAVFAGCLSRQSGKLAQGRGQFRFAEDAAEQAGNMVLLAHVYAQQGLLDYYSQAPDGNHGDPRTRIALLEQAYELASRHAPAILQVGTSGYLAEYRAAAKDAYGADEALERAQRALEQAQLEGVVGTGFVSSAGMYSDTVWDEGILQGFRGVVELILGRASAVETIQASLRLKKNSRWRATGLADLAVALSACDQPEEASACLAEAHTIGLSQGSATVLHHIFNARAQMPPKWNRLRCIRELDERLRMG
jgi:tetratricopeptide (TPR) repeat protein